MLLGATVAAAIVCRHRPFALPATVGIAAVAAGFATARAALLPKARAPARRRNR
jgi:hypothetical protein